MMGSVKEASHAQYTPLPVSVSLFESLSCALPERDTCFYPQCLVLTIHLPGTETWLKTPRVSIVSCMLHCILKTYFLGCGSAVSPCHRKGCQLHPLLSLIFKFPPVSVLQKCISFKPYSARLPKSQQESDALALSG